MLQAFVGCKSSPITGPRRTEGYRKFMFPDYVTMAQNGGKVALLTHRVCGIWVYE